MKAEEYRKWKLKALLEKRKDLKIELISAKSNMGLGRIGKDKKRGERGSDICKRLRR